MRWLAGVATLSAAASGVAVAVLASTAAPPIVALGAAVVVPATLCSLLGWRSQVVPAGLFCYLGLAGATIAPDVPPAYGTRTAGALLIGAAFGVLAVEIGARAGIVVDARGAGDTPYGRLWNWPAAAIAAPYLVWRRGAVGRLTVVAAVAALLGGNPIAVWLGRGVAAEGATLVPVAILGFLVLPAVDGRAYVSADLEGSLLSSGGSGSGATPPPEREPPTSSDASGTGDTPEPGADARESTGTTAPDGAPAADRATGASDRTAPVDVTAADLIGGAAGGPGTGGGAGADRAPESSAATDVDGGGAQSPRSNPSPAGSSGASDGPGHASEIDASPRPSAASNSLPSCQNCGSDHPEREPRYVVSSPECTVVLCPNCDRLRLESLRTFDECLGPSVHDAVADDDTCAACGATKSTLEAHPVVPFENGGHRHPNNILPLCHGCHVAVEEHQVARETGRTARRR